MTIKELIAELLKLSEDEQHLNAAVAVFERNSGRLRIEEITEVYPAAARGQILLRGK